MNSNLNAKERKITEYVQYVHQIVNAFEKEVKKDYDLICIGLGGRMPHDVEGITVKFISYKRATIEQARKLDVELTEKLLKRINEHTKIRPFLREYPFTSDRIKITISFENLKTGTNYTDGSVALVLQAHKKLVYARADKNEDLVDLHREPYEEAYKIVMGNFLKKSKKNKKKYLIFYTKKL